MLPLRCKAFCTRLQHVHPMIALKGRIPDLRHADPACLSIVNPWQHHRRIGSHYRDPTLFSTYMCVDEAQEWQINETGFPT